MSDLILHNYFRSSTSVRVRVALNLKRLDYHYVSYALLDKEHKAQDYLKLNPHGLVPALQISPDKTLSQSLAIIEYLDETFPAPALLPDDAWGRARVRSLAMMIGCDIHPLNNLSVLQTLRSEYDATDDQIAAWFSKWVHRSFAPLEKRLQEDAETGEFCHGDAPGLADICLYAQVLNNERFDVDMHDYPKIQEIHQRCSELDAFSLAHPANQPDAV